MDRSLCEARRATERNDIETLSKLAAAEESRGGYSFILPSKIKCTGCTGPGAKSITCSDCRSGCALDRGIPHCGFCEEFPAILVT